jgi:GldM C-terminal domain/Gram-negative bacterial TonB protein C-terminal
MYLFKGFLTACSILILHTSFAQDTAKKDTTQSNSIWSKVEEEATYPGGNAAWTKYVSKNIKSPAKDAPAGKYQVIARFIVSKDGAVREVKAETKFGYDMEDEVIRVIHESGKWTPAMQNGKPVNAYRSQPVTFIVESGDFTIITAEPYTLYADTDNEISIAAKKVKAADIGINVVGGSAIPVSDGKFIIRVKKAGRITIEILNSKKDDQEIGVVSFEVKAKL